MNLPNMVIHRFLNAKPLVTGGTKILASKDTVLVPHVFFDIGHPLDKFEAQETLKTITIFVDLIPHEKLHVGPVAGGVFIWNK